MCDYYDDSWLEKKRWKMASSFRCSWDMKYVNMYVEGYGAFLRSIGYDEEAIRKKLLNSLCAMGFGHVVVMSFLKVDVMEWFEIRRHCVYDNEFISKYHEFRAKKVQEDMDVMKKLHPELFCSGRLARIRWQKLKL